MNILDNVKSFFSQDLPFSDPEGGVLEEETAWGSSRIYSGDDWPAYNPDDLVGRKGLGIYKKMMIDEQVKAVVRFRRNATTGRKYFFTAPETDTLSDDEKKFRTDLFNHIIFNMKGVFKTRLDCIMDGMIFGFSLTEKVYEQIEFDGRTWYGIKSLKGKPVESFTPYLDEFNNVIEIRQNIDGTEQTLNIDDFIHYVQNANVDEFYGQSEIREAYRAYFSKDITTRFHNMWLERMAGGFTWASPVKGKSLGKGSREYNDLVTALNSIRNNTSLILPSGIDLNVEHPNDTQAFERAIAMHDKSIAKALLVPNLLGLSEQGQTGSFAQSKTQLEAFLWDLDAEANYLEEILNEQLFKQLGDINFNDGFYPQFTFKKLSVEQIKDLVDMWSKLTGASVVTNTIEDENYMRNLLEMGERQEETAEDGGVIEITKQDTALNGAQVTSMLQITTNVTDGILDKDSAIQILITAYPITLDRAKSIIDPIQVKEKANEKDTQGINETQRVNDPNSNGSGGGSSGGADNTGTSSTDSTNLRIDDNQLMSKRKFALHTAIRRVDFAAIDRSGTAIEKTNTDLMANAFSTVVNDLIIQYVDEFNFDDPDMKMLSKIKVSSENKRELKNITNRFLKDGWKLGQLHAELEIKKGLGDKRQLMKKLSFASIEDIAVKYFNTKSFMISGDMSDKAVSIIRQEIMNGIQYTKTRNEVNQSIYDRFVKDGLVAPNGVPEQYINELLQDVVPAHRIETIVRTNTFEAINEGRIAFFEDPALDGFVVAYEYSSVLDSRTTAICLSLGNPDDPQIHEISDPVWDSIKPPNHFNCRALLVPIIEGDIWTESGPPQVEPAPGFG